MKNKAWLWLLISFSIKISILGLLLLNYEKRQELVALKTSVSVDSTALFEANENEKRGTPTYDSIIGSDGLPHYRVFFWVPRNATNIAPYANKEVNTNVLHHGPASNWSVVETKNIKGNEKLVFVYVPKTFVFMYGKGFEWVIHLKYIS